MAVIRCTKTGQHVRDFAHKPIEVANREGRTVFAELNGIEFPINPGDTADDVVERYRSLVQ